MTEKPPLVLTVEDDPALSALLERLLVKRGYRVRIASDGPAGLAAAREEPPDLILTDAMMPGLDGYALCELLQAEPALAIVPVIFLTALDGEQDKARALAAGAVDHLTKPVTKDALLAAVERHIGAKERWKTLVGGAPAHAPTSGRTLDRVEHIDPQSLLLGVLPAAFCRAHRVAPFVDALGRRTYAVASAQDRELLELLAGLDGGKGRVVLASAGVLDLLLGHPGMRRDAAPEAAGLDGLTTGEIVTRLLETAVFERASDIHIEPKRDAAVVRLRVDGDMRDAFTLRPETALMVVTSLKVMGRLDVAERRKPQDGSFTVDVAGRGFIVRLATSATPDGESLVLRLLEPWAKAKPLEELGMAPAQVRDMIEFAGRNNGLLLIAGPTGSGKTTTIYSLLQHIDCKKRSLMTIEDPIEYRIADANQQQVDEKAGTSFEALLKSSLRQDPDILFLGEMRDAFSAKMAVDFASTGHLTISSLHTTNATTAVFRLERVGVTRGAMADSLLGVVAQKLLKLLCPHCKQVGPLSPEERAYFAPFVENPPETVARPTGCARCGRTGYHGREGVYEIVKFYPAISEMIRAGAPISDIRDYALRRGDYLLPQHAIEKVGRLLVSPRDVYESVLLEEAEYRGRGAEPSAPAARSAAPEEPALIGKPRERAVGRAGRILVVDDDADTRLLIERVLTNRGHSVTLAADGVQALACLDASTFELIVSDINMPNLDGLKLLELLENKRVTTPVILLTAQAGHDSELHGLELGALDYIRKPVTKEVLALRVERALRPRS